MKGEFTIYDSFYAHFYLHYRFRRDSNGNKSAFGAKIFCKGLVECLATVISPLLRIFRYIFDCCCGWCQETRLERSDKKKNAKVRAFMPSRGPPASTSSSDSSSDEVNVYTKVEKKVGKKVTFCLVDENERIKRRDEKKAENESDIAENENIDGIPASRQKRIAPKTDISGRFNSSQPVKIFRDSGHGAYSLKDKKVPFPSGQASHNDIPEPTSTQADESLSTGQIGSKVSSSLS